MWLDSSADKGAWEPMIENRLRDDQCVIICRLGTPHFHFQRNNERSNGRLGNRKYRMIIIPLGSNKITKWIGQ